MFDARERKRKGTRRREERPQTTDYGRQTTLLKDADWAVPLVCRSEIRNILTLYMRHEGMSLAQARGTMERAEILWSSREFAVPSDDVLELTFHHNITAYDGEFVVLAKQLGVPFVTFDKPVRKAFPTLAVTAEEFLKH